MCVNINYFLTLFTLFLLLLNWVEDRDKIVILCFFISEENMTIVTVTPRNTFNSIGSRAAK